MFDPLYYVYIYIIQMQEVLKITPTDLEKTVIDTANSMIELGVIKKSKKSKPKSESGAEAEGRVSFSSPCLLSSSLHSLNFFHDFFSFKFETN